MWVEATPNEHCGMCMKPLAVNKNRHVQAFIFQVSIIFDLGEIFVVHQDAMCDPYVH